MIYQRGQKLENFLFTCKQINKLLLLLLLSFVTQTDAAAAITTTTTAVLLLLNLLSSECISLLRTAFPHSMETFLRFNKDLRTPPRPFATLHLSPARASNYNKTPSMFWGYEMVYDRRVMLLDTIETPRVELSQRHYL